jgi:sarcosine oxidase delta subunit
MSAVMCPTCGHEADDHDRTIGDWGCRIIDTRDFSPWCPCTSNPYSHVIAIAEAEEYIFAYRFLKEYKKMVKCWQKFQATSNASDAETKKWKKYLAQREKVQAMVNEFAPGVDEVLYI